MVVALVAGACRTEAGAGLAESSRVRPGLRVVAGAPVDDTTLASPAQALIVEVGDAAGNPVNGAEVRYEVSTAADTAGYRQETVGLCPLTVAQCAPTEASSAYKLYIDSTDDRGRVMRQIRLGTVAGAARLVIAVPALGLRDSVTLTVRPGAAAYLGGSAALRPMVRDGHGNVRPDPIAVTTSDPSVLGVDAAGGVVGREIGRTRVIARSGALLDTAFVTVVPPGRLVGYADGSVVTVDMNGANQRRVAPAWSPDGVFPHWSPDGALIAYTSYTGDASDALLVDSTGANGRPLGGGRVEGAALPMFARGGDVLYVTRSFTLYQLWREPLGGTAPPRMLLSLNHPPTNGGYGAVDVAPDGDRLVISDFVDGLVVADLVTGDVRTLGVAGTFPRWSPDGASIAYVLPVPDNGIGVIRADGSGKRVLNGENVFAGLAWSPDGQYIVARSALNDGSLRLTRVSDGTVLPFTLGVDLREPSWR